jgi:hypothetical protein
VEVAALARLIHYRQHMTEDDHMARRTYSKTELGMLFGIFVGGGLGTVLFVSTGDPLYIALTGVGLVIGLIIGAGVDQRRSGNGD